jgi:phosphate starvation-inducible protein PhoH and related proteins
MQMKMFLTRMGQGAKVVVNGDRTQVDLPRKQKSGLNDTLNILREVEGIGFVEMKAEDVVRHKLVKDIVAAYNKFEENAVPDYGPDRPVRPANQF